jgi:hypothetical protein
MVNAIIGGALCGVVFVIVANHSSVLTACVAVVAAAAWVYWREWQGGRR